MKTRSIQLLSLCLILLLVAFSATACSKRKATKAWKTSGHADNSSMAFRDWDNASNPNATVSASCASCHSTVGFTEYLTHPTDRTIQNPPLATADDGITCDACHSEEADATTDVNFTVSGQTVANAGTSARLCGQCHQGRANYSSVDTAIKKAYATSDNASNQDRVSSKIGSTNPHYRAAFAAIKAKESLIGYDYGNSAINIDSNHAGGTDCMVCHDQHSTAIDVGRNGKNCVTCHAAFTTADAVAASNTVVPGFEDQLLATIQDYAADNTTKGADNNTKAKACIAFDDAAYPYWFKDANCDGTADNATSSGQYKSFTPRLAKACYNYLVSVKDPGGFAHNPTYMVAILTASITDLRKYNANLGK